MRHKSLPAGSASPLSHQLLSLSSPPLLQPPGCHERAAGARGAHAAPRLDRARREERQGGVQRELLGLNAVLPVPASSPPVLLSTTAPPTPPPSPLSPLCHRCTCGAATPACRTVTSSARRTRGTRVREAAVAADASALLLSCLRTLPGPVLCTVSRQPWLLPELASLPPLSVPPPSAGRSARHVAHELGRGPLHSTMEVLLWGSADHKSMQERARHW